jgi:diketogulonate reductase-like aldo/keto reductase
MYLVNFSENEKFIKSKLSSGDGMPLFGLGTYQMKGDVCTECVKTALKSGYRLIDTAVVYRNESDVGLGIKEALQEIQSLRREDIFVTTKIPPTKQGEEKAYSVICESLKKLGLDYIDLVLIHWPGVSKTPLDSLSNRILRQGSWSALQRLKDEGLVRNIGVSNFNIDHLEHLDGPAPAVNQVECHPFLPQKELHEYCTSRNILLQAYSSLGRGADDLWTHPTVLEIASRRGLSVSNVLLLWALQRGISVIPKTSKPERILSNAAVQQMLTLAGEGETLQAIGPLSSDDMLKLMALNRNAHYCWDPSTVTA